jgi:hypothetical protein
MRLLPFRLREYLFVHELVILGLKTMAEFWQLWFLHTRQGKGSAGRIISV